MTIEQIAEQLRRIDAALLTLSAIADAEGDTALQESLAALVADLSALRRRKEPGKDLKE